MRAAGVDTAAVAVSESHAAIRRMLVGRRRELLAEIQSRARDVRDEGTIGRNRGAHAADTLEAEPEDDLPFALIHMKTELLARINEAVRQIDDGAYGVCGDCAQDISPSRLRAMPFAVRCRDCEEIREDARRSERNHPLRGSSGTSLALLLR